MGAGTFKAVIRDHFKRLYLGTSNAAYRISCIGPFDSLVRKGLWFALNALLDSKATDPRDKVYGVLGLFNDSRYADDVVPIEPNYNLSVQEVYIKTARYLISSTKDWRCWSNCNRPSRKVIPSLLSWVPDWIRRAPENVKGLS